MLGRRTTYSVGCGLLAVFLAIAPTSESAADCELSAGPSTDEIETAAFGTQSCSSESSTGGFSPPSLWWEHQCVPDVVIEDDHEVAVFPNDLSGTYTPSPGPFVSIGDLTATVGVGSGSRNTMLVADGDRRFSSTRQWAVLRCTEGLDADGNRPGDSDFDAPSTPGATVTISVSGLRPTGGVEVTLQELVDSAYAALDPPDPPAFSHSPLDHSVTQLPTIMWIDEPYWTRYTQRDGFGFSSTWVEVTAVPDRWEFASGHGDSVICEGRGETWVEGMEPSDAGVCSYTYEQPSKPGSPVETETSVRFLTAWQINVDGYGINPLQPIVRATTEPHEIFEIAGLASPLG